MDRHGAWLLPLILDSGYSWIAVADIIFIAQRRWRSGTLAQGKALMRAAAGG